MRTFEVKVDKELITVKAKNSFVDNQRVLRLYDDKTVAQFNVWEYYRVVFED